MTLPDTYVIGAPKAGTTSLTRWLDASADAYVSVPKEPYHWASDYPRLREHYGFETRHSYENLYVSAEARAARRRVDGSTVYLYSDTAVSDIVSEVESPRFIVALRRPSELLVSYHRTQVVALNEDEPDFATAWWRSLDGKLPQTDPLDVKLVNYPRVGALGAAVERLLATIPRTQVHAVVFEDLVARPADVWTALARFLDLSTDTESDFAAHNASDKMFRSPLLRRLTHRPPNWVAGPVRRLRQWSRTTQSPLVARAKQRMWRPEQPPAVSADVRAELTRHFRDDVIKLEQLLGVDLSRWSDEPRD